MAKCAGSKSGSELERLVEAWLQMAGWRTHRAAAAGLTPIEKGGKKIWFVRSHDLFGCFDLLAVRPEGVYPDGVGTVAVDDGTWALQATSPDSRSPRRKKIAAHRWPRDWRVSIIIHESARLGRETKHWFRVEDYVAGEWDESISIEVDLKAIEAFRKAKHAERRKR